MGELAAFIKARPVGRWIWDAGTALGVLVAFMTGNVLWVVAGWVGGLLIVLVIAATRAAVVTRKDASRG